MKTLSAQFQADLKSNEFDKLMLLTVAMSLSSVRRTTDPVGATFNGQWYSGEGFQFSGLQYSIDSAIDQVTVILSNIDGTWSTAYKKDDLLGRQLTLEISSRGVAQSGGTNTIILFQGYVDSARFSTREAELEVKSWLDFLNQPSPRRRYSSLCNYALYDPRCTINPNAAANVLTGTATAGDSRRAYDATGLTQATDYWDDGVIEILSGSLQPMTRRIKDFAGNSVLTDYPFPEAIVNGTQYRVRRGCNKTYNQCKTKFSNQSNFGGFRSIPLRQFI